MAPQIGCVLRRWVSGAGEVKGAGGEEVCVGRGHLTCKPSAAEQACRSEARPVLETELAINKTFILATYLVKKKRTEKTTRNLKRIHNTKIENPNK